MERDTFTNTVEQKGSEMKNKLLTVESQAHRTESELPKPFACPNLYFVILKN
jgi:hypothetical protein